MWPNNRLRMFNAYVFFEKMLINRNDVNKLIKKREILHSSEITFLPAFQCCRLQ
jgi:hypothetical protein